MRLDEIPGRALAVFAHPDDPEVACAGTLARWAAGGCEARVIVVNSGDKGSNDPAADGAALTRRRADEVAAAAGVLGLAGHEVLGVPDGEAANDLALRRTLVARIRALRPDVVIAPDPTAVFFGDRYVNHHDHREVGWAAVDACAPMAASPLYFAADGEAHAVSTLLLAGTLQPDCWVDISGQIDLKVVALQCHASQVGVDDDVVADVVRARAAEAAETSGGAVASYAEGFRRLRLE